MTQIVESPALVRLVSRRGLDNLPQTIAVMLQQLRFDRYLSSATTLVGAPLAQIGYRHPAEGRECETRGNRSEFVGGRVHFTVGLEFPVNGKPGEDWRMCVAYEGDDTYSVWIWGNEGEIDHAAGVYNSDLHRVVVDLYDEAIRTRNGGFIPLD